MPLTRPPVPALLALLIPVASFASDGIEALGEFDPTYFAEFVDCEVIGNTAYIMGVGGLNIFDVTDPTSPILVGRHNPEGTPFERYYSGAFNATHAYCGAREYGLETIDISDPAAPVLSHVRSEAGVQYEGVVRNGAFLYAARHDAGIEILDITSPATPAPLSVFTSGIDNAYRLALQGTLLYVADGGGGIEILDVSTPAAPIGLSSAPTSGVAQDLAVEGTLLAVACGASGVDLFDVSVPASPTWLGNYDTDGTAFNIDLSGTLLMVADWDDIEVADVSNPAAPVQVGWEDTPGRVMGLAAVGSHIYVADWFAFRTYEYGNVISPDIHLTPREIVFGSVPVGSSANATITITNTGRDPLAISAMSLEGSAAFSHDGGATILLEDETTDVTVTFTPPDEEAHSAFLQVACNDPDEPVETVTLRGNDGFLAVGDAAPDFTLGGIDGIPYTLSDFRGQVVAIAFFASW